MDLNDPTTLALLAAEAFERAGFAHAVYGGLLTAAYGEPRETRDADFAVVDLPVPAARKALASLGVETLESFADVKFGGLLVSRLAVLGSPSFTGLNTIDLVRSRSPRYAKDAVARAQVVPLRERPVKVLALEDFLLHKALSTRERDLEDAASAVRRSGEHLEAELIQREIDSLSGEIPDFDVGRRYARIQELARSGR